MRDGKEKERGREKRGLIPAELRPPCPLDGLPPRGRASQYSHVLLGFREEALWYVYLPHAAFVGL